MVREKEAFLIRLMKVSDMIIVGGAFIAAYFVTVWIKDYLDLGGLAFASSFSFTGAVGFMRQHLVLVLVTIPTWIGLMSLDGVYLNFRTKLFIETGFRVLRTGLVSMLALGSVVFLLKMDLTSRLYVGIFALIAFGGLVVEKAFWKKFLDYSYRQGYNLVNILIVGSGRRAQDFIELVNAHGNWGLRIVGLVDDDPKLLGKRVMNYEIIGRIRDIPRIIREGVIDRVIFVVPRLWLDRIEPAIEHCEREGINSEVCVDLFEPKLAQLVPSNFAGIPLIAFRTSSAKEWQLFVKRMMDIILSLFAFLVFSPALIFAMIGIKATSRGPIFFRQVRSGKNGRKFTLYKFRSMVVGAEIRRKALERRNEMNGPAFKMRRDPRVTRFGRFMRKFSIDELPQFFNVLKGDMSLVGPRPAIPAEVDLYESWQRRRLSMKPGITCIWQVSGRNRIDFDRWMEMDLQYIDHFSIWLDLKLLFRTIFVVLTGYGAS
ncbi:MAG TPA: sugar transferase [bacterium]|nr:sugar transferase [bacterium]